MAGGTGEAADNWINISENNLGFSLTVARATADGDEDTVFIAPSGGYASRAAIMIDAIGNDTAADHEITFAAGAGIAGVTYVAYQTDVAGNVSPESTAIDADAYFRIDRTAPAAATLNLSGGTGEADDNWINISEKASLTVD